MLDWTSPDFFMSIDKHILYKIFEKMILRQMKNEKWKEEILWLGKVIIFSNPTENYVVKGDLKLLKDISQRKSLFYAGKDNGLPIGNYSSQFFGNLYLNELDQFVKRKLKAKYYLRYVVDFILFGKDKKLFERQKNEIGKFLFEEVGLIFSENKCKSKSIKEGINFLGYFIKPEYVLVRKRVVRSFKNKKEKIKKSILKKIDDLKKEIFIINSYCRHTNFGNSYNLRKLFLEDLLQFRQEFVQTKKL